VLANTLGAMANEWIEQAESLEEHAKRDTFSDEAQKIEQKAAIYRECATAVHQSLRASAAPTPEPTGAERAWLVEGALTP
jgi:hypothetical protein